MGKGRYPYQRDGEAGVAERVSVEMWGLVRGEWRPLMRALGVDEIGAGGGGKGCGDDGGIGVHRACESLGAMAGRWFGAGIWITISTEGREGGLLTGNWRRPSIGWGIRMHNIELSDSASMEF